MERRLIILGIALLGCGFLMAQIPASGGSPGTKPGYRGDNGRLVLTALETLDPNGAPPRSEQAGRFRIGARPDRAAQPPRTPQLRALFRAKPGRAWEKVGAEWRLATDPPYDNTNRTWKPYGRSNYWAFDLTPPDSARGRYPVFIPAGQVSKVMLFPRKGAGTARLTALYFDNGTAYRVTVLLL